MSIRLGSRGEVLVYPEVAQAALREHADTALAAYTVLKARDVASSGSGFVGRPEAHAELRRTLQLGPRQVQRSLRDGDGTFWEVLEQKIRLFSVAAVAHEFGIGRLSRPHHVPVEQLVGVAQRRASFVATTYRTDEQGFPTTRRSVQEQTGVPPSTQRRYDRIFSYVEEVDAVWAYLGNGGGSPWYVNAFAREFRDWGFFASKSGGLYRRHGSIRQAVTHRVGSGVAAKRANAKLLRIGRPATKTRGQRPMRSYFDGDHPELKWHRSTRARGRPGSERESIHPILNYSLALTRDAKHCLHTRVLREDEGASQLSGGWKHPHARGKGGVRHRGLVR